VTGEDLQPESERIADLFYRVWESAILVAALDLGLFELLDREPAGSAATLAGKAGVDARGVRILLDALCPAGLISKDGQLYRLTHTARRYLCSDGDRYLGPIQFGALRPEKWTELGRLAEAVRRGGGRGRRGADEEASFFLKLAPSIDSLARDALPHLIEHLGIGRGEAVGMSILDAACGTGRYGLMLLQADEEAELTLLDLPKVLDLARRQAGELGCAERTRYLAGDFWSIELPDRSYDLILLSQFIHSYGESENARAIAKLAAAQKRGGRLAVHDFIADEQRCASRFALLFAMNMYLSGGSGDTYTLSQIRSWMLAAGYEDISLLPTGGRSSFVLGRLA